MENHAVDSPIYKKYTQNVIRRVSDCAVKGSWLLISIKSFPKFYNEIGELLAKLREQKQVLNSFRMLFDFQNTNLASIPSDFLSNESVVFHLSNENMEDMEGFNDVWAHILNNNIVNLEESKSVINKSNLFEDSFAHVVSTVKSGAPQNNYQFGKKSELKSEKKPTFNEKNLENDLLNVSAISRGFELEQESILDDIINI